MARLTPKQIDAIDWSSKAGQRYMIAHLDDIAASSSLPAEVTEPPTSLTLEETRDSVILEKYADGIATNTIDIVMPDGPQRGLPPEE
jgi:hypothetical protein